MTFEQDAEEKLLEKLNWPTWVSKLSWVFLVLHFSKCILELAYVVKVAENAILKYARWPRDYFELKALEKQQLPSFCLKLEAKTLI